MLNLSLLLRRGALLLAIVFGLGSCADDILDLDPLTAPTDATFFSSEAELELALTGVYRSLYWQRWLIPGNLCLDNATDLNFNRGDWGGYGTIAQGGHSAASGSIAEAYQFMYEGIGRANNLLNNMERAEGESNPQRFQEIRAEALFLRAYHYHLLIELFGDVPYVTKLPVTLEDVVVPRTDKGTIVNNLVADMEEAAAILPTSWEGGAMGRATRAAAQVLMARALLYNGEFDRAANVAKTIMDEGTYSLYPEYRSLFQDAGIRNEEVIFDIDYQEGFMTTWTPQILGSRFGGWSQMVPTPQMVDAYECTDGLPIDESPLFDPANPYENRDPRLDASIVRPGTEWTSHRFETHSDSLETDRIIGGTVVGRVANLNAATPFASGANRFSTFTGYTWRKLVSEESLDNGRSMSSDLNTILMRLSEVMLIYAEGKIESGDIDDSVLQALNAVRARAYGVGIDQTDDYPAVTSNDQAALRRILRRERKVELANEGFRLIDIRRWRIAEKVMPGTLLGAPANGWSLIGGELDFVPQIDEDGHVTYAGAPSMPRVELGNLQYRELEERIFDPARDYLWPIPQADVDASGGVITQNPGY